MLTTAGLPARVLPLRSLYDRRNYGMDGLDLLKRIPDASIKLVIFDPQYDHLLKIMRYGATTNRQKGRRALPPQDAMNILAEEFARPNGPRGGAGHADVDDEIEATLRKQLLELLPARWRGEETGVLETAEPRSPARNALVPSWGSTSQQ
jgi:hypothetical protein